MTATELELMKERAEDVDYNEFDEVRDAGGVNLQTEEHRERLSSASNNQEVEKPNRELQDVVEKLQSLCMTRHEIDSPDVDHEPQALLCWRNDEYCTEETQELHEEVKMLSAKLRFSTTQREAMIVSSAAKLAETMAANRALEKELHAERRLTQAREKQVLNLRTRVEALAATNHMLQSMMSLKKTSTESMMNLKKTEPTTDLPTTNLETTAPLEPTMNQEMMKKSAMESIESELLHLAAIASTQNACVVRLSLQNEFLHAKVLEGSAEFAAAAAERDAAVCALEQFKRRMVEWAADYELLRAYALGLEGDLREYRFVFQQLEEVRRERDALVEEVEKRDFSVREREQEVESVGREALRVSLEVELLRRKVRQLEEDVMFKDGQISILRGHSCWRVPEFVEGTSAY